MDPNNSVIKRLWCIKVNMSCLKGYNMDLEKLESIDPEMINLSLLICTERPSDL